METKVCKECGRELPIEMFKTTRFGTKAHVCTPCAIAKMQRTRKEIAKQKEEMKEAAKTKVCERQELLATFTPRELMKELARRGYKGTLRFVQEINIESF